MAEPDLVHPVLPSTQNFGGIWAKLEIFLGLAAAGAGLLSGDWLLNRPLEQVEWLWVGGSLALFVLGGYLALAGHWSHLYRSILMLRVDVSDEIQGLKGLRG
jgi:hypothetical protein